MAPIIGITSSSATTNANATAYSLKPDDEQEDQRGDAGAHGDDEGARDVAADAADHLVAELVTRVAARGRGEPVQRVLGGLQAGQEVQRQDDDDERA